ncbi:MAG: hypothetical protein HY917_01040 [Candidatus Diapherotrites archaeon]|nr:hypothetical protein [Candidatus Diapherotrites archaeon]
MIGEITLLDIFGASGLIILLIGFYLEHFRQYARTHFVFNLTNLIGSAILGIYAYEIGSNVFLALEFIWAAIAGAFLLQYFLKEQSTRKTQPAVSRPHPKTGKKR